MFGFLKDKLKKAVSSISDRFKKEGKEEMKEESPEEIEQEIIIHEKKTEERLEEAKIKGEKAKKEERKKEEELIKIEEEKLKAEKERKKIEEEKKKLEEERKEKELEAKKAKNEEKKQKETELKKIDADRKKKEEQEREKIEEIRKKEVEEENKEKELRAAEDRRRKQEVEASKLEAEKKHLEEEEKKPGFFGRLFGKKKEEEASEEDVKEEPEKEKTEEHAEQRAQKERTEEKKTTEKRHAEAEPKGFFGMLKEKVATTRIDDSQFNEFFWDLELAMLENNVAVEVIEKIKDDMKKKIVDIPIKRGKVEDVITETLRTSISDLLSASNIDIIAEAKKKKPYVICFVGINGSGKTTTIAKFVKYMQKNSLKVVIAASDTFRAAAIDQLQLHADKLGVRLIKHDYGSDAAAVAFDAVKHAEAKGVDVVLIDTAGRLHSNINLMDEMKKIVRVAKPDINIFVGESITGNDCVEQAKKFNEAVRIDGIILAKADIDDKGGAAISVSYVTGKPILFLGMGQGYDDLMAFDKDLILKNLGF